MKILCEFTPAGPSYVRSGWGRVFNAAGHRFVFWNPSKKSAFDAFSEVTPNLFIGTTYGVDRAVAKCIAARPQMKVALYASAWGPYVDDIDRTKYPIVLTTDAEKKVIEQLKKKTGRPDAVFIHAHDRWLEGTMSGWRSIGITPVDVLNAADLFVYGKGRFRPELASDIAFVGGYWPYKARNIDRFLLPLCHPSRSLNVKIFGNTSWPVPQYLGTIQDSLVPDLFASAMVCPSVSEPHSTDLGFDCIERPFKILAGGVSPCVSDYVEEFRDIFTEDELPMVWNPQDFEDLIRHYIVNRTEAAKVATAGKKKVINENSYFERVCTLLEAVGMENEIPKVLAAKGRLLECLS